MWFGIVVSPFYSSLLPSPSHLPSPFKTHVPLFSKNTGSSRGRGTRAAAWFKDYIVSQKDTTMESLYLEGGIKGWAKAGDVYVSFVDGYEASVWAAFEEAWFNEDGEGFWRTVLAWYSVSWHEHIEQKTDGEKIIKWRWCWYIDKFGLLARVYKKNEKGKESIMISACNSEFSSV